jgi:hypothetical protein
MVVNRKYFLCGCVFAGFFLAWHLPLLAPAPDDIDAVNFALGLREFNPERHQPHPPGYPIFIGMGRLSYALLSRLPSASNRERAAVEARALAFWSAFLGAVAVFPLLQFFAGLESNGRRAWAATAIAIASPLFWFTSVRPLSDVPGLTVSLVVQALVVVVVGRLRTLVPGRMRPAAQDTSIEREDTAPNTAACDRLLIVAAFVAGGALGIRSQTMWLTLPPLLLALWYRVRVRPRHAWHWSGLAFVGGTAMWAVPLILASGGPTNYFRILRTQAEADITGVDMLLLNPTPRKVALALYDTLVLPWGDTWIAAIVLGAALLGGLRLLWGSRPALLLLATVAVPYGLFHVLFQETPHTRYALPLVPAVSYLAASGFALIAGRAKFVPTLLVVGASLYLTMIPLRQYARVGSPVFRAASDVRMEAAKVNRTPVLAMHNGVWMALRGEQIPLQALPSPPNYEWLELTKYWREGGSAPVWFLARTRRTDLALIDPASRRLLRRYEWPFRPDALLGGVRPNRIDWYEIREPGWFAEQGWSLTPEVHGISYRDHRGPAHAPIFAFVRRRPEAAILMIGGRRPAGGSAGRVEVALDRHPLANWTVQASSTFLRTYGLPAGALVGQGRYARIEVSTAPIEPGAQVGDVAIDQFDLQSVGRLVFGFDDGWHAVEYDPVTGRLWRWSNAASRLRVESFGSRVRLRLQGESPLKYFRVSPKVSVRAGTRLIHSFSPNSDFELTISVPAEALHEAQGILTIETTGTFVPDETVHNGDHRRLGLRLFDVRVELEDPPR